MRSVQLLTVQLLPQRLAQRNPFLQENDIVHLTNSNTQRSAKDRLLTKAGSPLIFTILKVEV